MQTIRLQGVFHRTKSGFGYVSAFDNGIETCIPVIASSKDNVFDGDEVLVVAPILSEPEKLKYAESKRFLYGNISKIIQRKQDFIVGTFTISDGKSYVVPDNYIPFRVAVKNDSGSIHCEEGDKVIASLCKYKAVSALRVVIFHNFGDSESFSANALALISQLNLSKPFSLESIEQARAAAHSSIESQSARRVDLRGKTVFTLGDKPFTRRGVAFSVQKDGSNFVVGIHVCDVAEYVAPNTALDNDAKLRAKSLYNNSDKYNMLPFELLSGICSIVMNEPRIAVSAFVTFDADANVVACKFCESVISSVLDGTFSDIDVLLQSSDDSAIMSLRERYGVISDQIFDMYSLAALLKSKRISSGGVDYDHTQTVFNLSNDAVPISMECVADTDSNLMLKEICIAAGDVAGKTLGSANFECVYMGVDEPLYDSCKDAPTAILPISENFDISKHGYIRAAIDKARIDGNEKLIYNCITASLDSPCYYNRAASNLICSTDTFCNFFAPDASYSSLLAQRCIKSFINNERILVEQSVNTASINESLVFNAERELKQCLELIYMKTQIGVKFRGTVLAFSSEGTLVMLDCGAIGYILNGTCKRSFYLGDNVNVFVSDVSLQSKSIIFKV